MMSNEEFAKRIRPIILANLSRRETLSKINAVIDEAMEQAKQQSLSPEKIKGLKAGYRTYARALTEELARQTQTVSATGDNPIAEILTTVPQNSKRVRLNASSLIDSKIEDDIFFGNQEKDISSPVMESRVKEYAETLDADKKENLLHNYQYLSSEFNKRREREKRRLKAKIVRIDSQKYLGAQGLSSAKNRQMIYNHWENASKKYIPFKKSLDALIEALKNNAKQFENIGESAEVQKAPTRDITAEQVSLYNRKLKDFEGEYDKLQYIADFSKMEIPYEKSAKDRLVSALIRIQTAQRLSAVKEEFFDDYDDDSPQSETWETQYMKEIEGVDAKGKLDAGQINLDADATQEQADSADDIKGNELAELYKDKVDPLLAYEMLKKTRLLALDDDSLEYLTDTLENYKNKTSYLNFQTDLNRLLEEVQDSIIEERDNYYLPISILSDSKFAEIANEEYPPAIEEKGNISLKSIEGIENLLEDLHGILTDKKFGFETGVRTSKRRGSTKPLSTQREAGDKSKRVARIDRLATQRGRRQPLNPATRGRVDTKLSEEVREALGVFLKAFNEYYTVPIYSGKTPIEFPTFTKTTGYRALTVLARDVGVENVLGGTFDLLSTDGRAFIKAGVLSRLATFLETLDEPSITVTPALIKKARNASRALSELTDNDEPNHDYFAAVLKHYMDKTDDQTESTTMFFGKTIAERARDFEEGYEQGQAYAIFALPQFIDTQQALLTRTDASKAQYNKLKNVLSQVEEYLPVTLNKLLKAHDIIRTQTGRDVEYGFMPVNINSYDKMITKMEKEHGVDLSHYEVENIVKAVDSHSNIAKEYGITTDQVYIIKANFR